MMAAAVGEEIVNLAGPLTRIGAARAAPGVAEAVAEALASSFLMSDYLEAAGLEVARVMEAEHATFTHCTAASIAIAVAACIAGSDAGAIARLPDTTGRKAGIVMLKGHDVDYGATVGQMVRLAGGRPIEVGAVNRAGRAELKAALARGDVAAALYVLSPYARPPGLPALPDLLFDAHAQGVPVIVDAAGETCWTGLLDAGADLVLISAQKELAGPTCGVVAGRLDLVRSCMAQQSGIGRAMKPSKEAVAGTLAAVAGWAGNGPPMPKEVLERRLDGALARLSGLAGCTARRTADPLGKAFARLELAVGRDAALTAGELAEALAAASPRIMVGDQAASEGRLLLDLRWAADVALDAALAEMQRLLEGGAPARRSPPDLSRTAIPSERFVMTPFPDGTLLTQEDIDFLPERSGLS